MAVCLHIHNDDNVVVALEDVKKGSVVWTNGALTVCASEDIKKGHKAAIVDLEAGQDVMKYGYPIGRATRAIRAGEWVHEHNMETKLSEMAGAKYVYTPKYAPYLQASCDKKFSGYRRKNGAVGVRNEIWVIPTVSCVNRNAELIAERAWEKYKGVSGIDGIFALPHAQQCSQGGGNPEGFRDLVSDLINHPNAGGVLLLSLGCEQNLPSVFADALERSDPGRVRVLIAQEVEDEIAAGVEMIDELVSYASQFKREPVPMSELSIGVKCGGSDAFSGITGNPVVGKVADRLASCGGSVVITELPELFGAEQFMMNRAENEETFQKIVDLIEAFMSFYTAHGLPVYGKDNPGPGNKAGGLTTLEEKALGGMHKSGTVEITGVLKYGEVLQTKGVNVLGAEPDDVSSITALAASGCQIVIFTTGRGTPVGTCVPTIKVSTNTDLFEKKSAWLDFNAGRLVTGESLSDLGEELLDLVLDVASGRETKSEKVAFKEIAVQHNRI